MSDRIAIFRQGKIAQIGTPAELYDQPETRFVAAFLGESDFLAGKVQAVESGVAQVATSAGVIRQNGHRQPAVGSDITIALRPEKLALLAQPAADGRNCLAGQVRAWRYLGGHLSFEIGVTGIGTLKAEIGAAEGQAFLAEGKPVWLAWHKQDGVIVDEA